MKKFLVGSATGLLIIFAAIVADGVRKQMREQVENRTLED